ncbi:MAG: LuxR C-terminal-related transcriptional regulator [Desulfobacterales bacterium]|nr:LuxR C-terminal-related transcriptional regulator [Desulfobacterales bacterium]
METNATASGANPESKTVTDPLSKTVLNSLSAHIAILDEQGVILETNRAWRNYAGKNHMKGRHDAIGVNYLNLCGTVTGKEAAEARAVADGIRSVIRGDISEFLFDYPCHSPYGEHWYYMRVIRMQYQGPVRVVVSHEDITALKFAEASLKKREQELKHQTQSLEEANIALKVLLEQREADKLELEKKLLTNIKQMVFPYLNKLKNSNLKPREKTFVEIIDAHLKDIISPFLQRLAAANIFLTPQEMQIAALIRDGKSSKEIADLLNVSDTTVHFHRKNLRIKFGLTNTRTNLRSYLLSLS